MLLFDSHVLHLDVGCVVGFVGLDCLIEFSHFFNPGGLGLFAALLEVLDLDSGLSNLFGKSLDHFLDSLVLLDGCLDSFSWHHGVDLLEACFQVDHAV